ncbi:MAG: hypothetical protein CEO12_366 [Parcubacteria group bacterium Gr01-1014_46]|nr:MAG: hypothetical protein CEO12_366 [Parcubacteria group bacterium Gr01-1014_46]
MEGPGNFEKIHPKKAFYEEKIWQKAEELSSTRVGLIRESEEIFAQVQSGNVGAIGLEAKEKSSQLQVKYFGLLSQVEEIKKQETILEEALTRVNNNDIDEEYLDELLSVEKEKLSKRKQRIMEERAVTGVDPRSGDIVGGLYGGKIDSYIVKTTASDPRRITSGHHAKRIKGNLGSGSFGDKDIERQFFVATQDTHGGKAGYGKKGKTYISSTGKVIRKK